MQNNLEVNVEVPNRAVDMIGNIIDYYYIGDPAGNLISHSKYSELITLIHVAYNGYTPRELITKINNKCLCGYSENQINEYVNMINDGQIELKCAVKELFTLDDLKFYGL